MEAVIWANEEGNHFGVGTLGSGVAAGNIGREVRVLPVSVHD
jgi:hypothetical protein